MRGVVILITVIKTKEDDIMSMINNTNIMNINMKESLHVLSGRLLLK